MSESQAGPRIMSLREIRDLVDRQFPPLTPEEAKERPLDAKFAAIGTMFVRLIERVAAGEATVKGMLSGGSSAPRSESAPPADPNAPQPVTAAPAVPMEIPPTTAGELPPASADPDAALRFIQEGIPVEERASAMPAPAPQPQQKRRR